VLVATREDGAAMATAASMATPMAPGALFAEAVGALAVVVSVVGGVAAAA
jgi:hypothetical protein